MAWNFGANNSLWTRLGMAAWVHKGRLCDNAWMQWVKEEGCFTSWRRRLIVLLFFPKKLLVGASWRHRKPQEAFSKVLGAHQSLSFGFGALQGPKRKGAGSPEWQRTH